MSGRHRLPDDKKRTHLSCRVKPETKRWLEEHRGEFNVGREIDHIVSFRRMMGVVNEKDLQNNPE